jgi:hypothetical protein
MMRTVNFARWTLGCNLESTKERYAGLTTGAPEQCGCEPCRNFAAQRAEVYPAAVLELFESLGIEANREAEIYHMARLKLGKHLYGGWFHFVGSILDGQDAAVRVSENLWRPALEKVSDGFSLGFTSRLALVPKSFDGLQVVQLEFNAQLPWTLESKEPE